MEEDIKILENYIKLIDKGYCEDCNELCNIYGNPAFPSKAIAKAIEHLIKEYKKKDTVIEKMAEQLTSPIHNKEWVIEYFKKEVEREVEQ